MSIMTPSVMTEDGRRGGAFAFSPGRKVRTPQGSVLGNSQARKRDG
jgi:hypothetical protein